jgi:menaquinone-9 beta-reductase
VTADLVIVGGGPAGAAAACLLARHGRRPLLLERETGAHDKVCGDFVSVEAQAALAALGLDVEALGGARIRRFRLVRGRQVAEADLPFAGVGLSRRVLDEALLQRGTGEGAGTR